MKDNLQIAQFLTEQIEHLNLVVIGDIMLDLYYQGSVARISPEAPVPVNKVNSQTSSLGGAANVAANLARLGTKVYMCAICGQDENYAKIKNLLEANEIETSGVLASPERVTTSKLRVIGSNQQMLRLDFEENFALQKSEENHLLAWLAELVAAKIDGIILSDYAKGLLTPSFCQKIISLARQHKIPVLVDPKGYSWEKYKYADYITPNVKELGEAMQVNPVNDTDFLTSLAKQALEKYQVKSVLITRSEQGMTFVSGKQVFTTPATAREVYDVSGAGDTVAAVFLAGIVGGLTLEDSAYLANEAAAIVVSKTGTYAVTKAELLNHLLEKEYKKNKKYRPLSWEEIATLAKTWHQLDEKIVFTNGCFDILHTGHITYLEKAADLGEHLIVGLNSDASVRKLKGETRPLVAQADRAKLLASLSCVDAVVLFEQDTPAELIELIKPDVLVKGGDYAAQNVVGREHAKEVKIIDFEDGYSTTGLIEKIASLVKEGKL